MSKSKCRTKRCKNDPDNGEGWNGYCGTCADRLEERVGTLRGMPKPDPIELGAKCAEYIAARRLQHAAMIQAIPELERAAVMNTIELAWEVTFWKSTALGVNPYDH